jgi:hypothetical protein
VDVGSGNGYWTYMLRRMKDGKKNLEVVPVDNGLSDWRTLWVPDTVEMDGAEWLKKHNGGRGHVLLLVYPQVSHDFTAKTVKAYREFFFLLLVGVVVWDCWADFFPLLHRWIDDCRCGHAEREWLYGFRGRVACRLVCPVNAWMGESVPNTAAEFRRQGRGSFRLREEGVMWSYTGLSVSLGLYRRVSNYTVNPILQSARFYTHTKRQLHLHQP